MTTTYFETLEARDLIRRGHAAVAKAIAHHPLLPILNQVVRSCRRLNAEMPMQQFSTFLEVVSNPGITAVELARQTDMLQPSVSRNIHALSPTHRSGRPGLGLIDQHVDRLDRRRYCLQLTSLGQEYAIHLLSVMSENGGQSNWTWTGGSTEGRLRGV